MSWTGQLRPAFFAGIGFFVKVMKAQGGQRLVLHEIPQANADLEPLGPLPKKFTVTAYVLGDDWLLQREALLAVLDKSTTTQTLVLPTKGPLQVMVGAYSYQDDEQIGAYGAVDVEFVVNNGATAPAAASDTASTLLNAISSLQDQIINAYLTLMGPISEVSAVALYVATMAESAAAAFLELPVALISGVSALFAATPTDPVATATAVTTAFLDASDNGVELLNPAVTATSAVTGAVPVVVVPADPSYGLVALASVILGGTAPAAPASLGVARAAFTALVQQSAALAVASLYAQATFSNASAAAKARAQLGAVFDAIGAALCDAGQVDSYRGWLALQTLSTNDMIVRAQNLPALATYSERRSLPDVALAQKLYRDGSQGDNLVALNAAIHPLFMPASGVWLHAE
jgi:prophage DNA circulation protein